MSLALRHARLRRSAPRPGTRKRAPTPVPLPLAGESSLVSGYSAAAGLVARLPGLGLRHVARLAGLDLGEPVRVGDDRGDRTAVVPDLPVDGEARRDVRLQGRREIGPDDRRRD